MGLAVPSATSYPANEAALNRYAFVTAVLQTIEVEGFRYSPPIADIRRMSWHVRFVPIADIERVKHR
jgi:hypothetical protein